MKTALAFVLCALAGGVVWAAGRSQPSLSGSYLEVRSCDVYTGYCVANSEMGTAGKEGLLVWTIATGVWNGTRLDGLSVIAVVQTEDTLGDQRYEPRQGKAVLIVDQKASARQREALGSFARAMGGSLLYHVVQTRTAPIEAAIGNCAKSGCASVKAGNLVEISTRCLGGNDHLCGNEENYYPPLTELTHSQSAFTELCAYRGTDLEVTWQQAGKRSAYLGSFEK